MKKTFVIILTTSDEYKIKLVTDRTLRSYRKKLLNRKLKDLIILGEQLDMLERSC